jgi:hypothetical protein
MLEVLEDPEPDLSEMLGDEPAPTDVVPEPEVSPLLTPVPEERVIKDIPPTDFIAPTSKPLNQKLAGLLRK